MVQARSMPASSNNNIYDARKLKKAMRAVFGNDRDQRNITAEGQEACKRLGIRQEELMPRSMNDFIEKTNPNTLKEENLAQVRLQHF